MKLKQVIKFSIEDIAIQRHYLLHIRRNQFLDVILQSIENETFYVTY